MMPTVIDLFSGACGGWSFGMHRAGFRTVAACEADPWRRRVYAHNFPGVKLYEDVRTLGSAELVRDLGRLPDVIVGSPPCQDASAANTKGRGVDGERTGLFFEAIRIVGECRPRWCAFENSPRLRTRGVDRLLIELEALGYTCWPFVVGADDIGAPHERKRMWLVAVDAERDGVRVESGRRGWPGRQGSPVAPHHSDADRQGEPRLSVDDEVVGELVVSGDADGAGLAIGEGLTGDARAQFEALERAVWPRWAAWNGRSARGFELAYGLPVWMAGNTSSDYWRSKWEGERQPIRSETVNGAEPSLGGGATMVGWRTEPHSCGESSVAYPAPTAGKTSAEPDMPSELGFCESHPAKSVTQPSDCTSTTRTKTGQTTIQPICGHCAQPAICDTTFCILRDGSAGRLSQIRVPDHKRPGRSLNAGRACISAYGDAVVPQITEAIGRAILRVESALACVGRAA